MRSSCGQWGGGSGVGRFGLGLTPLRHGLGAAESSLPVQAVGIGWATPHPCPSRRRRSSPQAPSPHSASESVNHMCCSLPESSSSCAVAVCLLTVAVEKGNIGNKRSFYFAFFHGPLSLFPSLSSPFSRVFPHLRPFPIARPSSSLMFLLTICLPPPHLPPLTWHILLRLFPPPPRYPTSFPPPPLALPSGTVADLGAFRTRAIFSDFDPSRTGSSQTH